MTVVTRHWTLSLSEVRILMRPEVLEKYQANPPEWFTVMFSDGQIQQIVNILKTAGGMHHQDENQVIDYVNKQPEWLREALIVILEEEIKTERPATVTQSSLS